MKCGPLTANSILPWFTISGEAIQFQPWQKILLNGDKTHEVTIDGAWSTGPIGLLDAPYNIGMSAFQVFWNRCQEDERRSSCLPPSEEYKKPFTIAKLNEIG